MLSRSMTQRTKQNQVWDLSHPDPRHWKVLDILINHQSDVTDLCWFQQVSRSFSMLLFWAWGWLAGPVEAVCGDGLVCWLAESLLVVL